MNLPPVPEEYDPATQSAMNETLVNADEQNFKLDRDNFFTTGSICLQSSNGKPVIASSNPYYSA